MKKSGVLLGLLVISILIICSLSLASAEVNETVEDTNVTPRAGIITPDSIFYGLDVFFDEVRVALTPTILGKATARLDIMQERVAEMEKMAEMNKTIEMKKAESEGQRQIKEFENSIKGIDAEDVPRLNELVQIRAAELEYLKQRLLTDDNPDNDDAIPDLIRLMETADNVFGYIDENLSVVKTFVIGSKVGEPPEYYKEMLAKYNCSGISGTHREHFGAKRERLFCCVDSDGSSSYSTWHYYKKGAVEYKVVNIKEGPEDGTIMEHEIHTDSCDGDMLTEWLCGEKDWRYSEEYECPHGCQDGACKEELPSGMIPITNITNETE